MCALSAFVGPLSLPSRGAEEVREAGPLFSRWIPEAVSAARHARPYMSVSVRFEDPNILSTDLHTLQRELGMPVGGVGQSTVKM